MLAELNSGVRVGKEVTIVVLDHKTGKTEPAHFVIAHQLFYIVFKRFTLMHRPTASDEDFTDIAFITDKGTSVCRSWILCLTDESNKWDLKWRVWPKQCIMWRKFNIERGKMHCWLSCHKCSLPLQPSDYLGIICHDPTGLPVVYECCKTKFP